MMCNVVRLILIFFLCKIYIGNFMIVVDVLVGILICEVGLKVLYVCFVVES